MGQPPAAGVRHRRPQGPRRRHLLGHVQRHVPVPDNVGITFSSRQFKGHGTQPEGIRNRMFGTEGVLETEYGGQVLIRGKQFYRGGQSPGIYQEGAVANIATFHDGHPRRRAATTRPWPRACAATS